MRKKLLAANWKMNLTHSEVQDWLKVYRSNDWKAPSQELRIYPSSIYIHDISTQGLHFGAQNFYFESNGAFTGEISIDQLQSIGVQSVLIGHSERRMIFKEDDGLIAQKVGACIAAKLPFIICCGETLQTRDQGAHIAFVLSQLTSCLSQLSVADLHLLTVAYEPIWAIGTGLSAHQVQITEMHVAIRNFLIQLFGAPADQIPILYGGSVNADNATSIFNCPPVDGALVGGASLDPHLFYELWKALQA